MPKVREYNNLSVSLSFLSMRNPIDFTHKSVYDQMDEDAAYHRRWRFAYKVASAIAFFVGFAGALYILKSL